MENSKFWKSHFQNLEEKIIVRPRLGSVKTWKVNKKKKENPETRKQYEPQIKQYDEQEPR